MAVIVRRFLGRDLTVPEDRLYQPSEGLWVREGCDRVEVGLAEPAVLMAGGVRQVDALVEEEEHVQAGQTVCLAFTAKLKYLGAPLAGVIHFPRTVADLGPMVTEDPYGTPLFTLEPKGAERSCLTDAEGYARYLSRAEGSHNPDGAKGGISSTCKAVYAGIREQTLKSTDASGSR